MNQSFIPDSPDSQLSDISFPSHVSGLESFNFDETTKGEEDSDNESLDTNQRTLNGGKLNKRKSAVHSQEKTHSSLSLFLKVSSLPKSLSTSQFNTLNESSISIGNLEAIQAGNQDSFLDSHSEDAEKEKKLLEFLDEARFTSERKENDKFSLSDAIESTYQSNTNEKKEKRLAYFDSPEINQTEMDSLFLKEVRERLQMSKADANDNSFIDNMTLKDLEDNDDNLDISRAAIEELEKSLALALKQTNNQNNVYESRIESVLRPNLDGSSSGSDSDSVTSGASNFARSGLGTGLLAQQNERSNLQENNLHLTTIPERQIAEGSDMGQDIDGDGGGGGDGSSGSSDSDAGGGDGGVSMRGARLIVNTNFHRLDGDFDERITPPNRERPVGGSSSQERQVQFSTYIQMQQAATSNSSDSGVTDQSSSSDHKSKNQVLDGQDSRLSARFFLAASTPFKDQSATLNWLHQSSFHKSTPESIHQDYTMDTPSSTVMGQLRQLHGEAPDWTFNSPTIMASKLQLTNVHGLEKSENDQTITDKSQHQDTPNASKSLKFSAVKPYNPFESIQSKISKNPFEAASENDNCFEQDLGSSFTSEEFHNENQDLEKMLMEDERVVAQNNNSIYKESEKSEVEWSAYSGLLTSTSESNGRVSSYFKVKSNELGNLSNTEGPRPKFSDDSHIIKTPPSLDPMPLLKQNYSFDQDKSFSVERMTKLSPQSSNQGNTESQFPSKCETPKSLHSTHKQTSDTVFKKCKQNVPTKISPQQNLTKTSVELQNKSFTIPRNQSEASNLFTDIQERRVSVIGLSNSQILELANCIATMTGTNLSLVYKVLNLLSKETKLSKSVEKLNKFDADVAEKSRSQKKTPVSCSSSSISNKNGDANTKSSTVPLNEQHSWFYTPNISQNLANLKHNTVCLNEGGFHSTQLEVGNVQNSFYKNNGLSNISPLVEVKSCYPKHVYTMQNSLPEFRLESKLDLVTRKNASLPEHLRLDELHSLRPRDKMYEVQPLSATKNTSQPEFYTKSTSTFGSSHGIWNHGGSTQSSMDIKRHHSVEYLKKQHLSESVIFPSEVNFEVVCVGIAQSKVFQLHNSNNFWLQCQIHSIFVARNGREVEKNLEQPFIFPPKIQLEPHASEDLKMKFHAVHPGSYVMKIEILVAPLIVEQVPISWTRVGNILDVVAVAEFPDIEVLLGEKKSIDFGLIVYGANTTQTLCILNKGRADVPIQLCIAAGTSSSKYFTFGMTKVDNSLPNFLSILATGQQRPGVALVPAVVTLRFTAPENSRQYSGCEEIACQIDVQTETDPVFPIASITMKARVGKARLHSLRTLQVIEFSCNIGETAVRLIPLRNAGAILMDIEAKIVESCDEFSVTPISLQIKPEHELNLKVTFNPKKSSLIKGKLVVSLLPDGDQYEWSLHGKVTSNSIISKNDAPALLCNKLAMNWGGVEVGQSRQQKLVLRNSSETQALNLSIAVADNPSSFQIQNSHEFEHKDLNKFEVILKPQAEFPVYVLFIPSKLAFASSSLVLRVINGSTKFLIPLSGYGGASNLEIKGAKSMNDKLFIDLGQVGYGKKAVVNIILRNNGSRAAFVSVDCYSDIASSSRYPESKIDISPNNFTLKEYCSEQLTILFESIKEFQGSFAHLVIVSGDEILRQQYKKNRKRSNEKYFITPFKLELACLDKWFSGENDINSDLAYSGINDWENFFATNISTNVVSLVASSIQFDDNTVFNNKLQDGMLQFTPAQKLSLKKGNSNSKILDNKKMSWDVTPNEIILNASNKNSNVKLQLINYTDVGLSFEFIWPAQTLIINPCKEKIPAKSSLGIKINVKPSFLSQPEDIPWFGSLYIQCNNEQKEVKVYIRNDVISELSPYTSNAEMNPLEVQDVSLIPHQHKSTNDIDPVVIISPCILEFKDTIVNMNDESVISVQSLFSNSCRWVLSSIAPPYFKSSNGRGEIMRATYSAFRFAKHSGKLGEYQTIQLSVTFHPRALGIYSQFWDFEIMYEGNHPSKKHRLELVGKGMFSDAEIDVSVKKVGTAKPIPKNQALTNTTDINENIQEIISKPNTLAADDVHNQLPVISQSLPNEGSVFIKDENVVFNSVAVGDISEQKFRLCNDSKEIQKVRVSGFQPPFSVIAKHVRLSIRPKSYIRVPVYFSPTSPKTSYEGVLIVTPERGDALYVKLKGISL